MTTMILATLVYLVGAVLAYGAIYAHFQGKYPTVAFKYRRSDKKFAFYMSLLSFLALLVFSYDDRWFRYGFRWKDPL